MTQIFPKKRFFVFWEVFFCFGLLQIGNTLLLSEFADFLSDFRAFARTVPQTCRRGSSDLAMMSDVVPTRQDSQPRPARSCI
jgi:hypothetical protein